jgi:hypothetical protein
MTEANFEAMSLNELRQYVFPSLRRSLKIIRSDDHHQPRRSKLGKYPGAKDSASIRWRS